MANKSSSSSYVRQPIIEDVLITDDGSTASITIPTLGIDYFDRSGNLALWKLCRIFECGRVSAVFQPEFVFRKTVTGPNKSAFIILLNMDVDKAMYKRARDNRHFWHLRLTTSLCASGNSTFDYATFIEDTKDKALLATLRFKYAAVDMTTRKSFKVPDELKAPFVKHYKPHLATEGYKPQPRDVNSYSTRAKVMPSDIDRNGHLNNSIYVRLCLDSATEASLEGCLRSFKGDICYYLVKKMKALYQRECRMGEVLTVHCWEDPLRSFVMHFEIVKEDGRTSFCSEMEFFPNTESHL